MTGHNITRMIAGALLMASGALSIAADDRLGGAPAFEGVDWELVQFRTGDTMQDTVASEHNAVLRFDAGRLSGSAGCNRLMGVYHGDGNKLSFEPHIAATMMACPPPLMEQEQAVIDAFEPCGCWTPTE